MPRKYMWTVENAGGSEAGISAERRYPRGINADRITLVASRASIKRAQGRIGEVTHVRLGSSRPFVIEPVELMTEEEYAKRSALGVFS
jgi:hypothetical protein